MFWRGGTFTVCVVGAAWSRCLPRTQVGAPAALWACRPQQGWSIPRKWKATVQGTPLPQLAKKKLTKQQRRALSCCLSVLQTAQTWDGCRGARAVCAFFPHLGFQNPSQRCRTQHQHKQNRQLGVQASSSHSRTKWVKTPFFSFSYFSVKSNPHYYW